MKIRIVGDIHRKFEDYKNVVSNADYSIQLGDFGVGYGNAQDWDKSVMDWQLANPTHKFFRGNHDNLSVCKHMPNFVSDGTYDPTTGIFVCGGAMSIDRFYNVEGISWWADEELSQRDFSIVMDAYEKTKPRIMLTHDCPQEVAQDFFYGKYKLLESSITRQALQSMFEIHKPELWIFGHWHSHRNMDFNGTKFICLEELQHIDIEVK